MPLTTQPVSPANFPDLVALFGGRGGPKFCWCMVNRHMEPRYARAGNAQKQAALQRYVEAGTPVGLLAYADGDPIGWCSIGPLQTFTRLRTRDCPVVDTPDDIVWSISCFFVRARERRTGLTSKLLEAAIDYARANGATVVEGYPVRPDSPTYHYMGMIPTFERLGFQFAGMSGKRRHVMQLRL